MSELELENNPHGFGHCIARPLYQIQISNVALDAFRNFILPLGNRGFFQTLVKIGIPW